MLHYVCPSVCDRHHDFKVLSFICLYSQSDTMYAMITMLTNQETNMSTTKQQVAMNLCYLTLGDSDLMNDIIIEYVSMLPTMRMHDLHEYTSQEIENDWGRG